MIAYTLYSYLIGPIQSTLIVCINENEMMWSMHTMYIHTHSRTEYCDANRIMALKSEYSVKMNIHCDIHLYNIIYSPNIANDMFAIEYFFFRVRPEKIQLAKS